MAKFQINVNGSKRAVEADADSPLMYVLRDQLELHGPKFGCGLGACGACTVHVDGRAIRSCVYPVSAVGNRNVTTLEGLGSSAKPSPLQQAADLLKRNPKPTEAQIREGLATNLCRCGTHQRIVRAVQRASGQSVTA